MIRATLEQDRNVMALTATATLATRKCIMKSLEMQPTCHIISRVPFQTNIKYIVKAVGDQGLAVLTEPLVDELLTKGVESTKTLIYCQSYMELLNVYRDLVLGIGEKIKVRDEDGLNKGRFVEKYDSCTDEQLKTAILQSSIVPNGVVCVVVATCAFGMGIDCPNVYKVFHWGPLSTIAMYVQW